MYVILGSIGHLCFTESQDLGLPCVSEGPQNGAGKSETKKESHSLISLQLWVSDCICHTGQRAYIVLSDTTSSWPHRNYLWQRKNQDISPGSWEGGASKCSGYSKSQQLTWLGKRSSLIPKTEGKKMSFKIMNKMHHQTMTSLWYDVLTAGKYSIFSS